MPSPHTLSLVHHSTCRVVCGPDCAGIHREQGDGVAPAAEGGEEVDDAELGMDLNKSKKKKKKKVR